MKPEEVGGIKEAISILENQDSKTSDTEGVEIITPSPTPIIDERHSQRQETPVYRGNRKLNTTEKNVEKDEYRLIIVGAGFNFNNSETSRRRPYRFNGRNSTTPKTTVGETPRQETEPNAKEEKGETPKEKKEELLDQIESETLTEAETAPLKRIYRSSAEKEIEIINNERVQIVRPSQIRLDEAVLGKRFRDVKDTS